MSHSGTVSKPHPYGWPADGADGVEVLVHSVQQPQQELLGVVLSVPFKLRGVFGHRVLQRAFGITQINGILMLLKQLGLVLNCGGKYVYL